MATNNNGIIYYKLDANVHGYPGDITKNCGLRGEEIDGNFNFLRGSDVMSVEFNEEGTLYLTKYNGEVLIATQTQKTECECDYDFNYNTETGVLTIVKPNGNEVVLEGFKNDFTVNHDYSLQGDGSKQNPLRITNNIKTGRYLPANKLVDLTIGEELPKQNVTLHDRYVTKEVISQFGHLYSLSDVNKISKRLSSINSEWHVPTKAEWDELLNAVDCGNPNHNELGSNIDLGDVAGTVLKSNNYWVPIANGQVLSEDDYGFCVYPVGYCGNRGQNYYGSFGEAAAFWSSTVEDEHDDMYVKVFEYNRETVAQRTWGENYYLSLRLVKKYNGENFKEVENIDGFNVNCIHIPGTSLIWTANNIGFTQKEYNGFVPDSWSMYENTTAVRYFINDWNGKSWDIHEINEGEAIILYEGPNGKMHEWILVNGELVDAALLLKEEVQKTIDVLTQRLDDESSTRLAKDNELFDAIQNEAVSRQNENQQIWEGIKQEINDREDADARINQFITDTTTEFNNKLEAEINRATNAEQELQQSIDETTTQFNNKLEAEINRAISAEQNLQQSIDETTTQFNTKLDAETNRAIAAEKTLNDRIDTTIEDFNGKITNEETRATNAEQELQQSIDNAITVFNTKIDAEVNRATTAEDNLQNALDNTIVDFNNRLTEEVTRATTAEVELVHLLNEETEKRNNADAILDAKIEDNSKHIAENKVASDKKTIIISNPSDNGTNIDVNVDNKTIVVGNNGILSVASEALVQYVGENAIKISDVIGETKTVSLQINPNDKILTNDTQGLYSTLSLKWVRGGEAKDEIQLIGKDDYVISRIDVADFIKDGILDDVTLNTDIPNSPYLLFSFNSAAGKNEIKVPVKDLVDIYLAGNGLMLNENTFSIKIDENSEMYLTVSSNGLKLYGIENAINTTKTEITALIANETELRTQAITQLTENINNEISNRIDADNLVRSEVGALVLDLQHNIDSNQEQILKLNGDVNVDGSVKDAIFDSNLGVVVDNITTENASEQSLIKKFVLEGTPYIYVSNNTNDMKHEGNSLKTVITELHGDIHTLSNTTNENRDSINVLSERVNHHDLDINTLGSNIETNKLDINTNKNDINTIKEDINTIKADVNTNKNDINTIKADVNTNKNDINTVKENIDLLEKEINTTINNLLAPMQETIATLQLELNNTKEELLNAKTELMSAQKEIENLKATVITNITGVANEISVTVTDNTAVVGFAEDAYFVAG